MQFTLKPTPEELTEMIKELHKDMSKEELIKMLVRTGMYNEDGTLKDEFKNGKDVKENRNENEH